MAKALKHRICVLIDEGSDFGRSILRGANRYGRNFPAVDVEMEYWESLKNSWLLDRAKPMGVVCWKIDEHFSQKLDSMGARVVQVCRSDNSNCQIHPDDEAIGELAAEHLSELGLRDLLFLGGKKDNYFEHRQAGFRREAEKRGCRLLEYDEEIPNKMSDESFGPILDRLGEWLGKQEHPLGVFAANDRIGRQTTRACKLAGVRVPDDVAVLGADNGDLACRISDPPLSSVDTCGERIGYEAMAMLHHWMETGKRPKSPVLVPPAGVVRRKSTDLLAVADGEVAKALRYIRENFNRKIRIAEIHEHVGVPQRSLERRFKRLVGRPMKGELLRVQIEQAQRLLIYSELTIDQIAHRCGFSSADHFSYTFSSKVGEAPRDFRRRSRASESMSGGK